MSSERCTYSDWLQKLKDSNYACYWCGGAVTERSATKDHLQPTSRGGTDALRNIVVCCPACNCKKGNKTEAEFRQWLERACGKKRTGIDFIAMDFPQPNRLPAEECVEPGILRKVMNERDRRPSWFWRNPARVAQQPSPEADELLQRWLAHNAQVKE